MEPRFVFNVVVMFLPSVALLLIVSMTLPGQENGHPWDQTSLIFFFLKHGARSVWGTPRSCLRCPTYGNTRWNTFSTWSFSIHICLGQGYSSWIFGTNWETWRASISSIGGPKRIGANNASKCMTSDAHHLPHTIPARCRTPEFHIFWLPQRRIAQDTCRHNVFVAQKNLWKLWLDMRQAWDQGHVCKSGFSVPLRQWTPRCNLPGPMSFSCQIAHWSVFFFFFTRLLDRRMFSSKDCFTGQSPGIGHDASHLYTGPGCAEVEVCSGGG